MEVKKFIKRNRAEVIAAVSSLAVMGGVIGIANQPEDADSAGSPVLAGQFSRPAEERRISPFQYGDIEADTYHHGVMTRFAGSEKYRPLSSFCVYTTLVEVAGHDHFAFNRDTLNLHVVDNRYCQDNQYLSRNEAQELMLANRGQTLVYKSRLP
jgi:formylmethanofuran dehydrogenase subunit A